MGLDISLLGAFLGGLVSFLSPCILPLTPAYLCFLAGISFEDLGADSQRALDGRQVLILRAVAFVLGFSTIFVLLGATASALGQALTRYFDILTIIAGLALIVLGLHMAGLLPLKWLMREARSEMNRKPGGILGAYGVGLAFGFGWTPCVGPVLAAILLLSAGADTIGRGTLLLAAYAAGMGLPFIVAAAFAGPFLRWMAALRSRMAVIQTVSGLMIALTGLLIATGWLARIGGLLLDLFPVFARIG